MDLNITYRRSNSNSPHKPKQRTPKASPGASPTQSPLHERSQSQTNAASRPTSTNSKVYQRSPFPTLPSQVFAPPSGPHVFQDKRGAENVSPTIPPKSSRRSLNSSNSSSTLNRQNSPPPDASSVPPVPPLSPRPQSASKENQRPESVQTFADIFEPGSVGARRSKVLRKPAPNQNPSKTPPSSARQSKSTDTFASRRRRQNARSKEKAGENETRKAPEVTGTTSTPRSPPRTAKKSTESRRGPYQHKTLDRVRSQSTVRARPKTKEQPAAMPETPPSGSRPRSASSPDTPTEAFIQTLLTSGTNVQYPTIRQSSINSLRSQSSSTRPTYPAPLRLQRKRANSQLGRAASGPQYAAYGSSARDLRLQQAASKTSVLSQSTVESYGSPMEGQAGQRSTHAQRASANWADELGDVVPELEQPAYLWRQRSDYQRPSFSESRPTTRDSSKSGKGSFYHFLNDSKTAWANVYYRNESRNRLETPPRVTQVPQSWVFPDDGRTTPHNRGTSDSHSDSPASAGFPDTLYIRRHRPHAQQNQNESQSLRYSSSLSTVRTIHHSASQSFGETVSSTSGERTGNSYAPPPSNRSDSITALPPVTPPHNPTAALPPIPHLSPDKRHGSKLPTWRAPSLEDSDGRSDLLFGPTNRQILLFCIGFVLPIAWWTAAVLPLPTRPRLQAPEMRESGVGEWDTETAEEEGGARLEAAADLFNVEEVRKYQKARWWRALNRGMSVVGLCVVAAVITCAVIATR